MFAGFSTFCLKPWFHVCPFACDTRGNLRRSTLLSMPMVTTETLNIATWSLVHKHQSSLGSWLCTLREIHRDAPTNVRPASDFFFPRIRIICVSSYRGNHPLKSSAVYTHVLWRNFLSWVAEPTHRNRWRSYNHSIILDVKYKAFHVRVPGSWAWG